jgi:hypothetical protein
MTVKTTGFTLRDALEAKTKRLRTKLESLVKPSEELNINSDVAKLMEALEKSSSLPPNIDEILGSQKYANAEEAAALYIKLAKVAVVEGHLGKPRTRLGAEVLRDVDIDLDTVNYAFDRAMKQNHG